MEAEEFIKPTGDLALKPCPFCGSSDVYYARYRSAVGDRFVAICLGCMAEIDPGYAQDKSTVQVMWNKRVDTKSS